MSEAKEQSKLVEWADAWFRVKFKHLMCGEVAPLIAVPNEGKRTPRQGRRQKEMGLRKGMPDLILFVQNLKYSGLVIEMKFEGNTVKESQFCWLIWFANQGYKTAVCYSFEAAKREIEIYMGEKND